MISWKGLSLCQYWDVSLSLSGDAQGCLLLCTFVLDILWHLLKGIFFNPWASFQSHLPAIGRRLTLFVAALFLLVSLQGGRWLLFLRHWGMSWGSSGCKKHPDRKWRRRQASFGGGDGDFWLGCSSSEGGTPTSCFQLSSCFRLSTSCVTARCFE